MGPKEPKRNEEEEAEEAAQQPGTWPARGDLAAVRGPYPCPRVARVCIRSGDVWGWRGADERAEPFGAARHGAGAIRVGGEAHRCPLSNRPMQTVNAYLKLGTAWKFLHA